MEHSIKVGDLAHNANCHQAIQQYVDALEHIGTITCTACGWVRYIQHHPSSRVSASILYSTQHFIDHAEHCVARNTPKGIA